jgi:hypothetical protein
VSILSGQSTARTSSSRISAAVPGRVAQAGVHQAAQVVGQRLAEALGPSVTSSAVKPWTWMSGAASFTARVTSM